MVSGGLLVLARLWKGSQWGREPAPQPVSQPLPQPMSLTVVSNLCTQPATLTPVAKRCRKRVRVCRLYPDSPCKPEIHARALLNFIRAECPQFIGGYVPHKDLESFYRRDLCRREGWEPLGWTAIGRELGELTHKKTVRLRGARFVGYRIPGSLRPT